MDKSTKYLDVARGIGIFLVVLGHAVTKDMAAQSPIWQVVRTTIYTVHMPMFMLLAGYLFEMHAPRYYASGVKHFVLQKMKVYAIPYAVLTLGVYLMITVALKLPILSDILSGQGYHIPTLSEIAKALLVNADHQDSHLWFCYVMLMILLINRLLIRRINLWAMCGCVVLYLAAKFLAAETACPEGIWKTLKYLVHFGFGRIVFTYPIGKKQMTAYVGVSCVSLIAVNIVANTAGSTQMLSVLSLIAEVSGGILLVFGIAPLIYNMAKKKEGKKWWDKGIAKLCEGLSYIGSGRMSYVIYILHMPFLVSGCVFLLHNQGLPIEAVVLTATAVGIVVPVMLYRLFFSRIAIIRKVCFGMW